MEKVKICPNCSKENTDDVNFCEYCGAKITEVCLRCWVKKEQPYNCGYSKCPGYRLFLDHKTNQAK